MIFEPDMREHFVIDPLIGKRQQLLLATQLCRMVLKVRIPFHTLSDHLHNYLINLSVYHPGQPSHHSRQ